jgi:hypothetical protein
MPALLMWIQPAYSGTIVQDLGHNSLKLFDVGAKQTKQQNFACSFLPQI